MGWGSVAEEWKEVLNRLQSCDPRTLAGLSRAHSTPSKSDSVALGCSHYKPQVSLEKTLSLSAPLDSLQLAAKKRKRNKGPWESEVFN